MQHLVDSVRAAIEQKNWYAALSLALTLPDICGRLENPGQSSTRRYVEWCRKYVEPTYTSGVGPNQQNYTFLTGGDCYSLRCAVLHEGRDEIVKQRARQAHEGFEFTYPIPGVSAHCNINGTKLQLQVDIFCRDICWGVEDWLRDMATNEAVQQSISELMTVTHFWAIYGAPPVEDDDWPGNVRPHP